MCTVIQTSEVTTETIENHKIALESIPSIVQAKPLDAKDVVGPLTKHLIICSNIFNLEVSCLKKCL